MPTFATPPRFAVPARRPSATPVRERLPSRSPSPTKQALGSRIGRNLPGPSHTRHRGWDLGDGFGEIDHAKQQSTGPRLLKRRTAPRGSISNPTEATEQEHDHGVGDTALNPAPAELDEEAKENSSQEQPEPPYKPEDLARYRAPASSPSRSPTHKRPRLGSATGNARPNLSDGFTSSPPGPNTARGHSIVDAHLQTPAARASRPAPPASQPQLKEPTPTPRQDPHPRPEITTPAPPRTQPDNTPSQRALARPHFTTDPRSTTPQQQPQPQPHTRFSLAPPTDPRPPSTPKPHYLRTLRSTADTNPARAPTEGPAAPAAAPTHAAATAFSPHHRRKARFVEGGAAATARAWILDAAGRRCAGTPVARVAGVAAAGRVGGARVLEGACVDGGARVLLVAAGAEGGLAVREGDERGGCEVELGAPSWEVAVRGRAWVVCAEWRVTA